MREIKFRVWHDSPKKDGFEGIMIDHEYAIQSDYLKDGINGKYPIMQFTGIKDSNGFDIYEGDILEFSDKWEWYKGMYGIAMRFADAEERKVLQDKYDSEPMERRKVTIPEDYEWLLSSEIQSYWTIKGNIHENPELLC